MTNYIDLVEQRLLFEQDQTFIQKSINHVYSLLTLKEDEGEEAANFAIKSNPELLELFGFEIEETTSDFFVLQPETGTEDNSDEQSSDGYVSQTDSETPIENLNMDGLTPKEEKTKRPRTDNYGSTYEPGESSRTQSNRSRPNAPNVSPYGSLILNIDCRTNRREHIERWSSEINLIIQTDQTTYQDPKAVLTLIEHKTAGIVNNFVKKTSWVTNGKTGPQIFDEILQSFWLMFLGVDFYTNKIVETKKEIDNAKQRLTNMTLCDICNLEDFSCEYEKYLFKLDQNDYTAYIEQYLSKIPIVGQQSLARFKTESNNLTRFSLASARRIVEDELSKICSLAQKQKKLKSYSYKCCNQFIEKDLQFGCKPKKVKSYKKKKFIKKKFFKKKKKPFKPGKFFKKKDEKSSKAKFCPKKKKNCRCWICSEEGHYANECPNRNDYSHKVKILQEAELQGYVPIEENFEGKILLYQYFYEEDEPPDSSDESSSTSSSSESD